LVSVRICRSPSHFAKEKLILIGYSFGAEVLPFVVNRLPEELRAKVQLLVFLGPSATAQFELSAPCGIAIIACSLAAKAFR
jgi:type IV secretory pathway VirJ component